MTSSTASTKHVNKSTHKWKPFVRKQQSTDNNNNNNNIFGLNTSI